MTQDLTTITTPFGLLDEETRKALIAHQGPVELYGETGKWEDRGHGTAIWWKTTVYRVKPQPPKPREWWLVNTGTGPLEVYHSPKAADEYAQYIRHADVIHVREVLE